MKPVSPQEGVSRFEFSSDFTGLAQSRHRQEEAARKLADDMAECETAAYARGHSDGAGAEQAGLSARQAMTLEALGLQLEAISRSIEMSAAAAQRTAADLALAFARKLTSRLLSENLFAPVEQAFQSLLTDLVGQPAVSLRVHPELVQGLGALLAPLARQRLKGCDLAILADAEIAAGDCRIDWDGGGLVLDRARLDARLEELINRSFPTEGDGENP